MAVSVVSICNLALQKLGAARITALSDDSRNARAVGFAYEHIRDRELRAYVWSFAKKRVVLAPLVDAPAFDFNYAFALPSDYLRAIPPAQTNIDWRFETQDGVRVLLTNDGDAVNFLYIARVEDPTLYDPLFVDALAAKLAWHLCEEITQSNEKKKDAQAEYRAAIAEARRTNALENAPDEGPVDTWLVAREAGSSDLNYQRGYLGNG